MALPNPGSRGCDNDAQRGRITPVVTPSGSTPVSCHGTPVPVPTRESVESADGALVIDCPACGRPALWFIADGEVRRA